MIEFVLMGRNISKVNIHVRLILTPHIPTGFPYTSLRRLCTVFQTFSKWKNI